MLANNYTSSNVRRGLIEPPGRGSRTMISSALVKMCLLKVLDSYFGQASTALRI